MAVDDALCEYGVIKYFSKLGPTRTKACRIHVENGRSHEMISFTLFWIVLEFVWK